MPKASETSIQFQRIEASIWNVALQSLPRYIHQRMPIPTAKGTINLTMSTNGFTQT